MDESKKESEDAGTSGGSGSRAVMRAMLSYPLFTASLLVLAVVLALLASGQSGPAQLIGSVWAGLVVLWVARGMVRDVMAGHWGVDILAVIAITATVAVGEYVAALVVGLMLSGGEALEDYAAGRARRELNALLDRTPRTARRVLADGSLEEISAAEVVPGDLLLLRPAEVLPVDGHLEDDETEFDESSITGESLPVTRLRGEYLLSGSVNGASAVMMRAASTAADSQYARIVDMVSAAAESRAPVVRLADRYAVPFTVLSLTIAGLAWWYWSDPVVFAEVLVVATPCPLLIAAPVAFLGGMGRAARAGVIVKDAGTLERLSNVRTVAYDKTGTLTYGRPELVAVEPVPGSAWASEDGAQELLRLTASAEQYSSHVVAASVQEAARTRGLVLLPAEDAREEATNGVAATVDGRAVVVGKSRFVAEYVGEVAEATLQPGHLAVYVAVDGKFAGTVVMADQLRADAADTVAALAGLGVIDQLVLSGDAQSTADHVAADAGLHRAFGELLPQDKVRIVGQVPHPPVAMVGDGVNDAPALAAADVGIAMGGRGATAASESADVVILTEHLGRVATAVRIGQRTMHVALQSIWIGIALSVGLMLVAATGSIPAVVGALSQEVVDLVVIVNALRAIRPGRSESAAMKLQVSRSAADAS
ncbi:heavy metal translocating P-type ATPase [Rhodococcus sp. BP22]|uniref:heavy metal translocating P-type ATPase n=1 Tax=Rhodococcus sp. BP22 TaxID=2758566 RepID=UPI0021BD2C48|nr:heavy metal translocating P-type ATPase [Rhodococcus sp. BP22]